MKKYIVSTRKQKQKCPKISSIIIASFILAVVMVLTLPYVVEAAWWISSLIINHLPHKQETL